jgi:hypothetical protein
MSIPLLRLSRILLFFALLSATTLGPAPFALYAAENPGNSPVTTEDVEINLESISVTSDEIAEVKVTEPRAGFKIKFELNNGTIYELNGAPYDLLYENQFYLLSKDKQDRFLQFRAKHLRRIAAALNYSKGSFSTFGKIKNRIKEIYLKSKARITKSEYAAIDFPQVQPQEVVQKTLESADKKLWEQAKLLSEKSGAGFLVSGGTMGINGAGNTGNGGVFAYGLFVGWSNKHKTFTTELYLEREKFKFALTPMVIYGLVPKIGPVIFSHDPTDFSDENMVRKGQAAYPPGVPGVPFLSAYVTSYPDMFSIGNSSAIISFPSIAADAFTFLNTSERKTILRLNFISPAKGLVRLKFGPGCKDLLRRIKK